MPGTGANAGEDPRGGVWYGCPGNTFVILIIGGKPTAGALVALWSPKLLLVLYI